MNIVVLAGGLSPERDVSLTSGSLIANALLRLGHRVLLLDAYLGLEFSGNPLDQFRADGDYSHRVSETIPDLARLIGAQSAHKMPLIGKNVVTLCQAADLVFIAMHGGMGEDGTLQHMLDCFGIAYTGTNALGAALSMDKAVSKELFRAAGVPTPRSVTFRPAEENIEALKARLLREIGLPMVIKPNGCGSSVGVSIVQNEKELDAALSFGEEYDASVLAETFIRGRELTVGILGGRVLPPVEIIPHEGFYDYKNKYQGGLTTEICPAPLEEATVARLGELTRAGFDALHLTGYARFDYILDADGTPWCLEANALPGMTPTSLMPQMAAAVGISYDELCEKILALALQTK